MAGSGKPPRPKAGEAEALARTRADESALAATQTTGHPAAPPPPARPPGGLPGVGELLGGGRYEVRAQLGAGAMGTVFAVFDHMAGELVAFKFLTGRATSQPGMIERFRRELRAARKVTHPGVVRLYDLLEFDGRLVLSMEYVPGETLAQRLARSPRLPADELQALAGDLSRGLAAAHRSGVTHRDVKPANVILREGSARALLTDFGVSQLKGAAAETASAEVPERAEDVSLTREGDVIGTPRYMAPEQMDGASQVGPAADVYALGAVLYEAATGEPPHVGKSFVALRLARRHAPPALATRRSDLPAAFCEVIDRCLQPEPGARYPSAVALREALAAAVTLVGTGTHSVTIPGRRRSRWLALAIAAAMLLGAAGGFLHWQRGRLPGADRRVALVVEDLGQPADPALERPLLRLAEASLRKQAIRYSVASDVASASVVARIGYRHLPDRVELTASIGRPSGRMRALGPVQGPSVGPALARLLRELDDVVGAGQPEREPTAVERAEMTRLGTTRFAAYRVYRSSIDQFMGSVVVDTAAIRTRLAEANRLDPWWAHTRALAAIVEGEGSTAYRAAIRRWTTVSPSWCPARPAARRSRRPIAATW